MTYTTYPNATTTNGNTQNSGQQTPSYTNQNGLNPGLNSGLNTGPNFGTQGSTPGYFGGQNPFTQNNNPQNYNSQNYGFQNSFPQNWFSQIPTQGFFGQTPWQTPFNTFFPANYTPFSGTYGTPWFFPVNTGWNTTGAFGFYPSGYSNPFGQFGGQYGNQYGGQYAPVQYGSSTPWNTTIPTFSWSPFNTTLFNNQQNFRTQGFTAFNTPAGQYTPFNQYGVFNTFSPTTGQYGLFGGQYSTPFNTFGGYTPSNFFNSYPTGFSGTPNFSSGLQGFPQNFGPQNFGGTYSWSPANSVYGTTPWSFDGGYGWNSTPTNTFGGYNTIPFGTTGGTFGGGTFINGGTFLNGTTPFGYSNSWQNVWNTPAAFGGIYFPSSYVPGFTPQGYVQNALQGYQHGFHQGYQPVGQTQGGLQPSTFVQHAGDCCGIRQAA